MKANFTDFRPNVIKMAGLALENAGLIDDGYELYLGEYDHNSSHDAQSAHFHRYGAGLTGYSPRKSMEPLAFIASNN
jgi:hypothetical protein